MSVSTLKIASQKLEITDVRDIVVTEIVDDGAGGFVRALRIHGQTETGEPGLLVLDLRLQSASKADLAITTPELDF
jgi:hypothetical protein